jgi:hypothetical protein
MDFDSREILISAYKGKTQKHLRTITPQWACGENTDMIFDIMLKPLNQEYEIFCVKTVELVMHSAFFEVSTKKLFTGIYLNDNRIANILHRWEMGKFIDPPGRFGDMLHPIPWQN